MSVFHVDATEVARCSGLVRASAQNLRAEVATMMASLDALEASWSGAASNQFTATAANWRTMQVQLENALDDIGLALSQAATTYSDAEAQATAMFSGR
ncbi:MAG: WXG100 family type VII secretion target [Actinomycetaceae bacterium]|nr:WXG100 family type VII secretion target [Actinomycetaceae bacterium]